MRDCPPSMHASSRSACDAAPVPVGRMCLKNGLQKRPLPRIVSVCGGTASNCRRRLVCPRLASACRRFGTFNGPINEVAADSHAQRAARTVTATASLERSPVLLAQARSLRRRARRCRRNLSSVKHDKSNIRKEPVQAPTKPGRCRAHVRHRLVVHRTASDSACA
jgi:hypothetical protein